MQRWAFFRYAAQQYLLIRHYVLHYKPDVVVLLFCENDPYDSSPYLLPRGSLAATFVLDEHSQLEWMPPVPWTPSLWKQTAKSSTLARYLILQKNLLRHEGRVTRAWRSMQEGGFVSMVGGDMTLQDRGRKTWALIEALLAATRDECARHGATLLLAYAGNFDKLHAAFLGQAYAPPPREEDPFCLDPHRRQSNLAEDFLEPISKRLGIPCLDLTDAIMEESRRTGRRYDFPKDEHYSAVGHAAVGKALAAWIETTWAE